MIDHINKISKKSEKKPDDYGELDITNRLGFNKKKQATVNKDKINKGFSKFENSKNKETFKDQAKMSDYLKEKLEKTRKLNMKKVNTIKIKKVINK